VGFVRFSQKEKTAPRTCMQNIGSVRELDLTKWLLTKERRTTWDGHFKQAIGKITTRACGTSVKLQKPWKQLGGVQEIETESRRYLCLSSFPKNDEVAILLTSILARKEDARGRALHYLKSLIFSPFHSGSIKNLSFGSAMEGQQVWGRRIEQALTQNEVANNNRVGRTGHAPILDIFRRGPQGST
jgi:hypothetical protein